MDEEDLENVVHIDQVDMDRFSKAAELSILELLDSERETTRARGSISRYKRDQALALIALYRALGVGVPS